MKRNLKKHSMIVAIAALLPMTAAFGLSVQKSAEVRAAQTPTAVINVTNKKPPIPTEVFCLYNKSLSGTFSQTVSGAGISKSKIAITIDPANQPQTVVVKTDAKGNWFFRLPISNKLTAVKVYQIGENGQYSDAVETCNNHSNTWWY